MWAGTRPVGGSPRSKLELWRRRRVPHPLQNPCGSLLSFEPGAGNLGAENTSRAPERAWTRRPEDQGSRLGGAKEALQDLLPG